MAGSSPAKILFTGVCQVYSWPLLYHYICKQSEQDHESDNVVHRFYLWLVCYSVGAFVDNKKATLLVNVACLLFAVFMPSQLFGFYIFQV